MSGGPDYNIAETLDTVTLMRFLGTPGVPRLLSAYSRIPPGDVRDNLIRTAESIASAYELPPPGPMADPLLVASTFHPTAITEAAPQLAAPEPVQAQGPLPPIKLRGGRVSVEEKVVNLRMAGRYPDEIARELDVDAGKVSDIIREAREQGGLHFNRLPSRNTAGQSVFYTELKYLNNSSRSKLAKAAVGFGMSLEQYVAARKLFVEMRLAGRPMDDIVRMTRMPEKELLQWLYRARAAGLDLPLYVDFEDAQVRPVLPIRSQDAPIRLPSYAALMARPDGLGQGAAAKVKLAAKNRGLSIPDYEYQREVIIDLALSGMRNVDIAQAIGENPQSVNGVLSYAVKHGVVLPSAERAPPEPVADLIAPTSPVAAAIAKLPTYETMSSGAKYMIDKACAKRGITTHSYFTTRNQAIALRFEGLSYGQIADRLRDNDQSVRDWCKQAMNLGVTFPPTVHSPAGALAAE